MEATSVYQYRDSRGILLYVGITSQGVGRQLQHMAKAEWYRYYTTHTLENYDSREEAKARESWLIKRERPVFNRQENPDWREMRRAYWTMFDPGMLAEDDAADCHPCDAGEESSCDWIEAVLAGSGMVCGDPSCRTCHAKYHGARAGFSGGAGTVFESFISHLDDGFNPCKDTTCNICDPVIDSFTKTWEDSQEDALEHLASNIAGLIEESGGGPPGVVSSLMRLRTVAKVAVMEIRAMGGLSGTIADSLEAAILLPYVKHYKMISPGEVEEG